MKKGVPVSPGIAVARAYCIDHALARREPYHLETAALSAEINRYDEACSAAARELDTLIAKVAKQIGEEEASIFRAHRQLLRDPALSTKVKANIRDKQIDAASSLQLVLDEYVQLLSSLKDPYLLDRVADFRDVAGRVLAQLALQDDRPAFDVDEPVILVAPEILPSQALTFDRKLIVGILTEKGGATGHAAILARSLSIPAVSGIPNLMRDIKSGDRIALDGREGHVYLNPGPEVESAYRKLQREYVDLQGELIRNRDLEPLTADGVKLDLLANVNNAADAKMAAEAGAGGIGLYRTEFLFLTHPSVPDEEEQYTAYREVLEAAPHNSATIRTLDLGGDKNVPYFGHRGETNPFMGFRSIRLSSAYPEFFQTQLRAILRAGVHGNVSLLFPMISTLEEVQRLKKVVERTVVQLQKAGVPHRADIPFGVMLEVPAAALCVEEILREVDFVSIGSNDLIQYLMAADRDNPKVAHLCEPYAPALMRLLNHVIKSANAQNKPVTLCGEMAGRPRCIVPLLGMGLRRFSMSPAFVPSIKEMMRHTTVPMAEKIAERILGMHTVGEIRGYLTRKVRDIWPNVNILDTRM